MRVLIVEDNLRYANLLAERLKAAGFDADIETTAAGAERATAIVDYSAIVLDLGLPDRDGMDFLRDLRSRGKTTPVLIVTARTGLDDRRAGADDFLSKPFSAEELIARLHAVLRRPISPHNDTLRLGNVSIDVESRQLRVAGTVLPVRLREIAILEILLRRSGCVVPRRLLAAQLFEQPDEHDSNAIDVYTFRLRRHLADAGATVHIHTIRGVGFMAAEAKTAREPNEACA
jgi:DNA-binding response OmpR family regulator